MQPALDQAHFLDLFDDDTFQADLGGPVVIFDRHHGAGSATFPPIWPP